jgi:hypothetical protein
MFLLSFYWSRRQPALLDIEPLLGDAPEGIGRGSGFFRILYVLVLDRV